MEDTIKADQKAEQELEEKYIEWDKLTEELANKA